MPAPWEATPEWQSYLRAIGQQTEQARAGAAQRQAGVENLYGLRVGDVAFQGGQARERIGQDFESRGMYSSGGRLKDEAYQREGQARQIAGLEATRANEVAEIQRALAGQIAQYQSQQAERGFQAQQEYARQQAAIAAQQQAQQYALQLMAAQQAAAQQAAQQQYAPPPPPAYAPPGPDIVGQNTGGNSWTSTGFWNPQTGQYQQGAPAGANMGPWAF